jgi:hypothetical protein
MSPIDLNHENAFSCAMEQLNEAGYSVRRSNQKAGLIRAQRESSGALGEVLSGEEEYQIIEISIFQEAGASDTADYHMNVAAASGSKGLVASELGQGTMERGGSPSDETREDARMVIEECGGTLEDETSSEEQSGGGGVRYDVRGDDTFSRRL